MKAKSVKKLDPRTPLADNAARIVRVRLGEMRSFAPAALEFEHRRDQHDMRIAAKRLRYILEMTEFCFGRSAQTARRRARDLQDLLGELHDCDVMLPRVEAQLAALRAEDAKGVRERAGDAPDLEPRLAARAPHRTAYRGLEVLAIYIEARRRLLFDRFREFWLEQERAGTWDRLERAVARHLRIVKERRRAAKRAEEARRQLEAAERQEREAASRAASAAAELQEARRVAAGRTGQSGADGGETGPPGAGDGQKGPPEADDGQTGSPEADDGQAEPSRADDRSRVGADRPRFAR
jgi:hypothetical protein